MYQDMQLSLHIFLSLHIIRNMGNKAEEIVNQLTRYKNGIAADSMADKGLSYPLNYGVSLADIAALATRYAPDTELALQLLARPEREAKLAAIYITDTNKLSRTQIALFAQCCINSEMAEQIAMRLLHKTPSGIETALEWCGENNNEYLQKAGWMTLGRAAVLTTNATEQQFAPCIALLNTANYTSLHVRVALVYALPKIATKSAGLKLQINNWAAQAAVSNETSKQWVANELATLGYVNLNSQL